MSQHDDLGTLERRGESWAVVFTRRFDHPVERVWRAITEPEHLASWFPGRMEGELRPGALLKFVVETGDSFEGEVHLRILADAGFLIGTKIKQWIFYRRDEKAIAAFKALVRKAV